MIIHIAELLSTNPIATAEASKSQCLSSKYSKPNEPAQDSRPCESIQKTLVTLQVLSTCIRR